VTANAEHVRNTVGDQVFRYQLGALHAWHRFTLIGC
jgi:hypothetical protein